MKPPWQRLVWRLVKFVLIVLVLFFVGWQFAGDLRRLDVSRLPWRPGWLLACAALYLAALLPSAWFWGHMNGLFGYPHSLYAGVRAHYLGQLGKYVPGKAMAIVIRSELIHPCGVPYGVSIITSFYEVFTGMATGGLVAALVYFFSPPPFNLVERLAAALGLDPEQVESLGAIVRPEWQPLWLGAGLVSVCGLPLLPGVFNFVIRKLTAKIQVVQLYRLPPVQFRTLALGMLVLSLSWWVQGLSVWAMVQAVVPEPAGLTFAKWAEYTADLALANVAGFVIGTPAGLGVRELLLKLLLSSEGPPEYIAASVLLLRLDWIAAEAIFALSAYWCKPTPPSTSEALPRATESASDPVS